MVWVLQKIRHMIESSKHSTRIFKNHGAVLGIAKQTLLSTSSIDKLNLRLIRASEYLQRFNIEIRHKPDNSSFASSDEPSLKEENLRWIQVRYQ